METSNGPRSWTGGQLVVETLKALGVERVFGVPGGQTLAITDAILDEPSVTFVTTRHEGAAAVMADATGRLLGVPGVCLATTGPGATNLITGIGGALRDSSPVLALTCNNKGPDVDRDDAQNADHVALFRPLTKWATLVTDTASIPRVLHEAALRAMGGNPGPVLVDFTRTALESSVELEALEPITPTSVRTQRPVGDEGLVAEAAALIAQAASPVLWVGNGVQISGAHEAVLRLAEAFDLPLITTFNSIGAAPTMHPNVFGAVTRMGTALAHRALRGSDLLIAVGNSLNAVSTARWSLSLPERIIQIDASPDYLGRNYPARTFGILGDARATVELLHAKLADLDVAVPPSRSTRLADLRTAKQVWWRDAGEVDMEESPMSPATLVKVAREQSPDDTMLVVDAGNPGVWSYLWEVRESGSYLKPVGFGNMGFGLPGAIAGKLIQPDKPLVALIGDGSLGMTLGELETVVREDLAVCLIIMNDQAYGNIRQEQHVFFGNDRNIGVDFADVDFAGVATAFGMAGFRADTGSQLAAAVSKIISSGRPGLVDARIDPDLSAWTFPLFDIKEPVPTEPAD